MTTCPNRTDARSNNVLISSAGRRAGLLACIRDSITRLTPGSLVYTIDSGTSAPAAFLSGYNSRVPTCSDPEFVSSVLHFCVEREIRLVVPTIDPELPVYAAAANKFAAAGVTVCISSPSTVRICCDKIATHAWLKDHDFPTVRQTNIRSALADSAAWPLPLIAKPYNGSASIGLRRIETRGELEALADSGPDCILQEIASGREFTINVYVDRSGKCICAVPHWRMEVRAGEVSKGITVKDSRLIQLGRAIADALPGATGPLNIQCFMDDFGGIRIIEINARFGGGYPLAHRAGARFTDWLLNDLEGKQLSWFDNWTDDLAMLRYDEAIFVPGSRLRV